MKQMFDKRELALSLTNEEGLRIKWFNYPELYELCDDGGTLWLENEEIDELHLLMLKEDDNFDSMNIDIMLNDKIKKIVVYTDFQYLNNPSEVMTPITLNIKSKTKFASNYTQVTTLNNWLHFNRFNIDDGLHVNFSVNRPTIIEFNVNKKSFINKESIKYNDVFVDVKVFDYYQLT